MSFKSENSTNIISKTHRQKYYLLSKYINTTHEFANIYTWIA